MAAKKIQVVLTKKLKNVDLVTKNSGSMAHIRLLNLRVTQNLNRCLFGTLPQEIRMAFKRITRYFSFLFFRFMCESSSENSVAYLFFIWRCR